MRLVSSVAHSKVLYSLVPILGETHSTSLCYLSAEKPFENMDHLKAKQIMSPLGVSAANDNPVNSRSETWADKIAAESATEQRVQPWKKSFGTPIGGLDNEDWINYPAMYDMAKKGIKG
ncbi:hypothetical protein F5Y10DRAFT_269784 [Nemania abortiva]|nr:hypothetical protein F5Y10DRAFT_269784 [Nemania abortiva]